jgi:hypothetical protein
MDKTITIIIGRKENDNLGFFVSAYKNTFINYGHTLRYARKYSLNNTKIIII